MAEGLDVRDRLESVGALLRRAAHEELLPRFADLDNLDVGEKGSGEIVTEADIACERLLERGLAEICPEASFVGEESTSVDRSALEGLADAPLAWVVDPVDGTRNFARGSSAFGIQVALMAQGVAQAAWIYLPVSDTMACGARGEPVVLDGETVTIPSSPAIGLMRGPVITRFVPSPLREQVEANAGRWLMHRHTGSAAVQYVELLRGHEHLALYYRTLPWDHAPGAFLLESAGGAARRFDGARYEPGDGGAGLLVTSAAARWAELQRALQLG